MSYPPVSDGVCPQEVTASGGHCSGGHCLTWSQPQVVTPSGGHSLRRSLPHMATASGGHSQSLGEGNFAETLVPGGDREPPHKATGCHRAARGDRHCLRPQDTAMGRANAAPQPQAYLVMKCLPAGLHPPILPFLPCIDVSALWNSDVVLTDRVVPQLFLLGRRFIGLPTAGSWLASEAVMA